jgi:hypothetical protein
MEIYEDLDDEEAEASPMEEIPPIDDTTSPIDLLEIEPLISLHTLTSFFTPQTLKLIGYFKCRKFIILIDSGSTHNFIHHHISQEINLYIRVVNNFQIMIANGGSMKCDGCCESVHLHIG